MVVVAATACSSGDVTSPSTSLPSVSAEGPDTPTTATTTVPEPVRRDPAFWPHSADSIWNIGLGSEAVFAPDDDERVQDLRGAESWGGPPWIAQGEFSHPIAFADAATPVAEVVLNDRIQPGETTCFVDGGAGGASNRRCNTDVDVISTRIPADARADAGQCEPTSPGPTCEGDEYSDAHLHVIDPESATMVSLYHAVGGGTEWTAARVAEWDLTGPGTADGADRQWGTRAYGGSDIAGLMRCWELEAILDGRLDRFPHALALAINGSQLVDGWPRENTYVWPATMSDSNWESYSGSIPMGALVAIEPGTGPDLAEPIAQAIVKTLTTHGAIVVDQSGGQFALYAEPGCHQDAVEDAANEMLEIQQASTVVTNNTAATPGGGGTHPSAPPEIEVGLGVPVSATWDPNAG